MLPPQLSTSQDRRQNHAWVTVGTKPNGKPDRRHVKRRTKDEAKERVDELLAQKQAGTVVRPGRAMTVEAWLTTYLDTVAPRRCDPSTIYDYRSKMRTWVYPEIGRVRLDQLTADHLDAVYTVMDRAGRAGSTVLKVHRILSRALEVAYRRGHMPRNPARMMDAPSFKAREIQPFREEEAVTVLDATEWRRNAARWAVGLALGLRQGEVLGLRWPYVDLEAKELRVWWQLHRRSFEHGCAGEPCGRRRAGNCPSRVLPLRSGEQIVDGGLILKEPKGKSKRTVPLPQELVDALRRHREIQELEQAMAGAAWLDHGFVFATATGGPISPEADWDEWKALLKAAGVRDARVHDGRHTAATILLALGVPIEVVQELLGHSDIRLTRGYSKVASAMARDATDRIGGALLRKRAAP
ncbi:tyrosine-type recombinase/integrase [Plantactinospora sp. WMMB334]|uniref:tyrosine-type recombinase/integrase n=1 Tax=Plantactinospora sp. WMMB334 TaxID=3404119 RepID=UPI003B9371F4